MRDRLPESRDDLKESEIVEGVLAAIRMAIPDLEDPDHGYVFDLSGLFSGIAKEVAQYGYHHDEAYIPAAREIKLGIK
jgi:hypothetical protein